MYMRNSGQNKYSKYNLNGFPSNYSGQYTKDSLDDNTDKNENNIIDIPESTEKLQHEKKEPDKPDEPPAEKQRGLFSFLGNLFGGHKDKDGKSGGFLSNIELEDLIIIAVIFFLLKDSFDDDLILILAIILFLT